MGQQGHPEPRLRWARHPLSDGTCVGDALREPAVDVRDQQLIRAHRLNHPADIVDRQKEDAFPFARVDRGRRHGGRNGRVLLTPQDEGRPDERGDDANDRKRRGVRRWEEQVAGHEEEPGTEEDEAGATDPRGAAHAASVALDVLTCAHAALTPHDGIPEGGAGTFTQKALRRLTLLRRDGHLPNPSAPRSLSRLDGHPRP